MTKRTNNQNCIPRVEYFLKKKFEILGYEKFSEFIHFGLTSQDINNTAIPLLIKDFLEFESQQTHLHPSIKFFSS